MINILIYKPIPLFNSENIISMNVNSVLKTLSIIDILKKSLELQIYFRE